MKTNYSNRIFQNVQAICKNKEIWQKKKVKHNFSSNHWIFLATQISRKYSNTAQDRSKREKWSIRSQTPYNLAKWGSIIVFWALIASFYSNVYIVWYNMLDSGDMGELGHNRAKDFLNSRSYKAMIGKRVKSVVFLALHYYLLHIY